MAYYMHIVPDSVVLGEGDEKGYANPPIRKDFCSNPKPQPYRKTEV